ncbi:MAG: hypothetical protein ACRDSR_02400 [Pseudonocardiaceae bacterium]
MPSPCSAKAGDEPAGAGQAVLARRRQRAAEEALAAQRRAEITELHTALLSAVGHDLRTPLTSIKAAVGSPCESELCAMRR